MRQIAATKFYRSNNDFHMSDEAICCSNLSRRRVAAICRIVSLGLILEIVHVSPYHDKDALIHVQPKDQINPVVLANKPLPK